MVTLMPLTLKLTWSILGLGTLVKKVIVTNVLKPTFSLNVNATNVLAKVHAYFTLSLQVKLSPLKIPNYFNSRSKGPYPRLEESTRRSEE